MRGEPGGRAADRGTTVITDRALRRVVSRAAAESLGQDGNAGHAAVTRRGSSVRVSLGIGLRYPADSTGLGARVQAHVASRTAELTGFSVSAAEVVVSRLRPDPAACRPETAPALVEGAGAAPADAGRREWSARRLPAALAALAGTAAGGGLLYDMATTGGRRAARVQDGVLDRLADAGSGSVWPVVAGACLALLGAWLVVLALTPGARRLPMAVPASGVRAALDRGSARALLRDAALDVPGVAAARVRLRRAHRVRARVTVAFGDPDAVRTAVHERLCATLPALGTARPGRVRVGAVRDRDWCAPAPVGEEEQPETHEDGHGHENDQDHERGRHETGAPHKTVA
ncbi:DUF6286 domain-containing protein [Streptomyces enissocaesilis]|uniref:DUF6286 domain-containing protein n=1 Tax=Streptomyces enissocaesilis TaxID=332589 RepID=A0ABP6JT93_9ACTN